MNSRLLVAGIAGLTALALLRVRGSWRFKSKVVLITGGSRGLGLVMARQLAREGAKLALLARNPEGLRRAADELRRSGASVLELSADVGDPSQVKAAVAAVIRRYGRLDVLINNAGIIQVGPLAHMSVADFETAMRVHFWGPLYTMLEALPHLKERASGRIVNISSIGGKVAVPHLVPYSASKFALVGLSDGMRAELARDGVRVTTVCPWLMRTGSYRNVTLKGRHEQELTWFAVGDSLPVLSMSSEAAAQRILAACRHGAPRLVLAPYGKAAVVADALFPALTAAAMTAANRLLPKPDLTGDDTRTGTKMGYESPSTVVPSLLTHLSDRAAEQNNELE